MKCPVCGSSGLVCEKRDMPFVYKGQVTLIPVLEAQWCNACGEALIGPDEDARVVAAMKLFRQQVDAG